MKSKFQENCEHFKLDPEKDIVQIRLKILKYISTLAQVMDLSEESEDKYVITVELTGSFLHLYMVARTPEQKLSLLDFFLKRKDMVHTEEFYDFMVTCIGEEAAKNFLEDFKVWVKCHE